MIFGAVWKVYPPADIVNEQVNDKEYIPQSVRNP